MPRGKRPVLMGHEGIQQLFVYGSLRKGESAALTEERIGQTHYMGPATLSGYALFDLGSYPGIFPHDPTFTRPRRNSSAGEAGPGVCPARRIRGRPLSVSAPGSRCIDELIHRKGVDICPDGGPGWTISARSERQLAGVPARTRQPLNFKPSSRKSETSPARPGW